MPAPCKPRGLSRPGGFTLVEILITIALMGLVLLSTGAMIRAGAWQYVRFQTLIEAQQQSLQAIDRISKEIAKAPAEGIEFFNGPEGVVFAMHEGLDGSSRQDFTGRLYWQSFRCYYVSAENRLIAKSAPLAGDWLHAPSPTNQGRSTAFFAGLADPGELIARNVVGVRGEVKVDTVELEIVVRVVRDPSDPDDFDENSIRTSFELKS